MKTIEQLLDRAENLGWSIDEYDNDIEFQIYSPEGQDFVMTIEKTHDIDIFLTNIYEYYDCYDPSERAIAWTDKSGHGINGAPHDLEDIIDDMKWCKNAILELWRELKNYKENNIEILNGWKCIDSSSMFYQKFRVNSLYEFIRLNEKYDEDEGCLDFYVQKVTVDVDEYTFGEIKSIVSQYHDCLEDVIKQYEVDYQEKIAEYIFEEMDEFETCISYFDTKEEAKLFIEEFMKEN